MELAIALNLIVIATGIALVGTDIKLQLKRIADALERDT